MGVTDLAEVTINGIKWTVQTVSKTHKKLKKNLGICYLRECAIFIDEDLRGGIFKQTLLHELVHAFVFSFGVHFPENDVEESVCDFIAAHYRELSNIFRMVTAALEKGGAINA